MLRRRGRLDPVLAEIGDRRWRERLDALAGITADEATPQGGTVVKDTGDGALITFDGPGRALEFCQAVRGRARRVGLELRCGLHTGEIEQRADDVTGIAVVVAARVTDLADAGQILATRTVADMVQGGATPVEARGAHELRGVGGEWPLFLVAPEGERTEPVADASGTGTGTGSYRFGRYELHPSAFELREGGDVVAVEPQVLDVLLYLVQRAGELVTKEQLLDDVWGDRIVSESALTSRIRSARRAIGDDGKRQHAIQTVHGRGYRFVADLD